MNKYVLRTSLVWLLVFAVAAGILLYRSGAIGPRSARRSPNAMLGSGQAQPEAAGPAATAATSQSMVPEHAMTDDSTATSLAPVQLTQSAGKALG